MVGGYIRSAWLNIWARKLKAFLTMLGIVIGVASVMVVFSVSEGAQYLVLDQIRGFGSNLIGVLPGKSEENGPPASAQGIVITTLTYQDALDIGNPANAPFVTAVTPYVRGVAPMSFRDRVVDGSFSGTSAELPNVENVTLQEGRFFTEQEERGIQNVAVLGSGVRRELFPSGVSPIGNTIRVGSESFQVVGVLEERGVLFFQNQDDQIYIPVTTAQRKLLGISHLGFLRAKVDDPRYIDRSINDITRILRRNHRITDPEDDDFSVRSSTQALEVLGTVLTTITVFLGFVAGVSLLVGGIGIMNIMLMTVKERTREIGLRKAVGAPKRMIMHQFLVESVVLCGLAGVGGVLVGGVVSYIVSVVVTQQGYSWIFAIPPMSVVLALGVSCGVGVIFGYYPARKAAQVDPIIALRTE